MSEAQGIVKKVYKNKIGFKSLIIDDVFYNFGKGEDIAKEGQQVRFEFTTNAKGFHEIDKPTFKIRGGSEGAPRVSQAPNPSAGSSAGSRDDYWAKKEEYDKTVSQPHLYYRGATALSVEIVTAALGADALSLGSKKAEKLTNLQNYISMVRDSIYTDYINAYKALLAGESLVLTPQAGQNEHDASLSLEEQEQPLVGDIIVAAEEDSDDWH